MKPVGLDSSNVLDPQGLAGLKRAAKEENPSATTLRQVAGQFEALFMQMMLKSMREASFGDDLFGSNSGNFYRDMYDQQLSLLLAKKQGIGLGDMLVRQLGGDPGALAGRKPLLDGLQNPLRNESVRGGVKPGSDPAAFVTALWPEVTRTAQRLDIAPEAITAVAALETGWGSAVPLRPDGRSSFNLFGIKAGVDWKGDTVTVVSREYENGAFVSRAARFRAYDSVAASVADFGKFLETQPRYRAALDAGSDARAFVHSLARAGYATDPAYAAKLESILSGSPLTATVATLKNSGDAPIAS